MTREHPPSLKQPLEQTTTTLNKATCTIPQSHKLVKGTFELILLVLLLPVLLPISLITAGIIAITMGRPIFYTQQRIGLHGKRFKIYKFRTMKTTSEEPGPHFTRHNDARITQWGNWIRKLRLDELPQIFNILKGEMHFIGPRPEAEALNQNICIAIPEYRLRYKVKSGITGWAQVKQGHVIDLNEIKKKLQYDVYYIKNYTVVLDMKIVIKTIHIVLTGFGAK